MGRSFESIRMGVKEVSARWLKASKVKKEDQIYGQKLAEMARKHSSEAFYALDDPPEAAVFSALVEILKEMNKADCENELNSLPSRMKKLMQEANFRKRRGQSE
jgi:hypothetical protein